MLHRIRKVKKSVASQEGGEVDQAELQKPPFESAMLDVMAGMKNLMEHLLPHHKRSSFAKDRKGEQLSGNPFNGININLEPRDRYVILDLPKISEFQSQESDRTLRQWFSQVCRAVTSTAFNYYIEDKMTYDQVKIYVSQSILRNLAYMQSARSFSPDQMKLINECLKGEILQYLSKKYPLIGELEVNRALQKQCRQVDIIDAIQNDYLAFAGETFVFRQDGNYNDQIMRVLNFVLNKLDSEGKQPQSTNYKQFENQMTEIFSSDAYEAKKYGSQFLIGRKISNNVPRFSEEMINSKHLSIKNPAILRILTKWCEELQEKFKTDSYFINRSEPYLTSKNEKISPGIETRARIHLASRVEWSNIQKDMQMMQDNNNEMQAVLLQKEVDRSQDYTILDSAEAASSNFAVKTVRNLHNYIISYLNRLIHGLLEVGNRVLETNIFQWNFAVPLFLSFRIGDLMRCRFSSTEAQTVKVLKKIKERSQTSEEKNDNEFKIVRIKNRLKKETNDVLINIRFNNVITCQIQLSVKSKQSKFIQYSNKFGHYLYELQRSIMSPITEVCSIWASLDPKAEIYNKFKDSKKVKEKIDIQNPLDIKSQTLKLANFIKSMSLPFVCDQCQRAFSHSNYIVKHKVIGQIKICSLCQLETMNDDEILQLLLKDVKSSEKLINIQKPGNNPPCKRVYYKSGKVQIPKYGFCTIIQSMNIKTEFFQIIQSRSKQYLLGHRFNENLYKIAQINTENQIRSFFESHIVFQIKQNHKSFIKVIDDIEVRQNFIIPEYLEEFKKKEKEQLVLAEADLRNFPLKITELTGLVTMTLKSIGQIKTLPTEIQNLKNLKELSLQYNDLSENAFPKSFGSLKKLQILDLQRNKLQKIPDSICALTSLKKLNLYYNQITELPSSISSLVNLKELYLHHNQLTNLPDSFSALSHLQILNMEKNSLISLPDSFGQLRQLSDLNLENNQLNNLPESFGDLSSLKRLNISFNNLSDLPESFEDLRGLESLTISGNQFDKIPDVLKFSTSLKQISAKNMELQSLPSFFNQFHNLVKLDLSNNKLVNSVQNPELLTIISCLTNLETLNMRNNKISYIPERLSNLTKLFQLKYWFKGNPLTRIDCKQFFTRVGQHKIKQIDCD